MRKKILLGLFGYKNLKSELYGKQAVSEFHESLTFTFYGFLRIVLFKSSFHFQSKAVRWFKKSVERITHWKNSK
ncbi:hypothetical protein BpHYR1_046184 [Brachionus plicatilis]|uniref:Uncharacterized protein n=1 Tax=Brachionus plicatilis TaxID=10195 RepID=A0A3M7R637_BRAPC|nr:hypothetical protein BpHYR1_046184 [Brachionus plicatilis]